MNTNNNQETTASQKVRRRIRNASSSVSGRRYGSGHWPTTPMARLHGDWLDAAVDDEELLGAVRAMLARSKLPGAEEWGIFDYQGFGQLRIGQSEQLEVVARVARGIVQHGLAFAAWSELHDCDPGMLESFEDSYLGAYESREAWAQSIVDDFDVEQSISKNLPGWLAAHVRIDLAGIAHDLQISGDVWIEDDPNGGEAATGRTIDSAHPRNDSFISV